MGYSKQRKKPGWRRSSKCVQNAFFRLSPSERNAETPLESILPISISYHHFGWAFASSAKSRVDEGRPIAFKTRFFEFPHRGETKKHPWVRIPRGRFHTTIFAGLYQAAENAGLTKVVQLRSKLVLSSFPIGAKRKNTLGFEFHEVGFIPPFLVGFFKQRKKPGWRRSSNCVQNSFFRLSQSGRNEKTPFGSNSTRSVSYHHFWWAFPSSAKSRVDEGRPIAFKTRFFDFPHRGKTKKHPWIEFNEFVIIPPFWEGFTKERKTPGWRKTSNCVENSFFRVSPYGRNEKTPFGSNSTRSVWHHHFGWAFASSAKRRVDECRPIALKTRFFEFPHRCQTKKHPWDRIPRGRFHTTILGGIYKGAENAGLTKSFQLGWKLVSSSFPIGAKRKNTLGFEFHEVGFIPPFLLGFTKQRKTPGWRRSSNCVQNSFCRVSPSVPNEKTPLRSNSTRSVSYHHFGWDLQRSGKRRVDEGRPIVLKTRFFEFPHMGESKKHPLDRIPRGRFHTTVLSGIFQAAQKAGLTKVVQLGWKLVLSSFPIGTEQKNTLGIKFHEVGFIPPFLLGFCKQCKKAGWRMSSNCVENSFFRVSPSGRNEKTPFGSNSKRSASYHTFGSAFPSSAKRRVDEGRPIAFKTPFFRLSPSGQNEKTPLGSNSTRSVSYHHFGVNLPSSGKRWVDEGRPIAFKTLFFEIPRRGKTKKHPWDRIPRVWFQTTILGRLLQAAQKASCVVHRVQCTVSSAESTVYRV